MIMTPRNDSVPDIPGTAAEPDDDDEEEAMVAEQLRSTAAMARLPMFRGYEPPHSAGMLSMIHHPPIWASSPSICVVWLSGVNPGLWKLG